MQLFTNGGNVPANQRTDWLTITHPVTGKEVRAHCFISYGTMIVAVTDEATYLDEYYWDYSATTGRYRNQFLGEGIADTRKGIKAGAYKLADLNR